MNRFQHAIPAGLIALVGLWVCFVSYTQTPAAAFAFPRLISTVFVVLALWTFFKALRGSAAHSSFVLLAVSPDLQGCCLLTFFVQLN